FTLGNAGFVGSANGTHLAIRAQAGFTGNSIDVQAGGVRRFGLSNAGAAQFLPAPSSQGNYTGGPTTLPFRVRDQIQGGGIVTVGVTKDRNQTSGLMGLHLDRDSAIAFPHGISYDIDGVMIWDAGLDFDATVGGDKVNTDLILALNPLVGGDILRLSGRAPGSGGAKFIFGQAIGTPAAQATCGKIVADTGVGGLELTVNSGSAAHVVATQAAAHNRTEFRMDNVMSMGSDFGGANLATWYLRDLVANAHRIFVDQAGNVIIGGSTTAAGKLGVNLAPTASANFGLIGAGDGGWSGSGSSFVGSAFGTLYAGNAAGGFAGNLIDLQIAGSTVFRVGADGTIYKNGVALGGGGDAFIGLSNAWSAAQTFTLDDTGSGVVRYPVRVRHTHSAGAGAAGIGSGIQFEIENSSGSVVTGGQINMIATDPGSGNFSSEWRFPMFLNGIALDPFIINGPGARFGGDALGSTQRALLELGNGGFTGAAGGFSGSSNGTVLGLNLPGGSNKDLINAQLGGVSRFQMDPTGLTKHTVIDTVDNATTTAMRIAHRLSSGTPTTNYGVDIQLRGMNNSDAQDEFYGSMGVEMKNLGANTLQAELVFMRRKNLSITEVLRFNQSDQMVVPVAFAHTGSLFGAFAKTPAGQQTGGALTAGASYGANEQTMLQRLWDMGRNLGFLS
ncbi:MAG TPA: hypothetical protein VIM84_05245, partial [Gemmatimonadales bacterium]